MAENAALFWIRRNDMGVVWGQSNWHPNWTHIVSYSRGNIPGVILFYDAPAGIGEFWEVDREYNMSRLSRYTGWRNTWTHIIPGSFSNSLSL